ncbi:hypothetical protein [Microbacterium sp. KNMS]
MAWFKIDDGFYDNPKVKAIPRGKRMECLGLWVSAGTWSSKHLTDGRIPAYMVEEFGADVSHGDMLVAAGLWRREGDGYAFHDWLDWQPSRADTLAAREKERRRKDEYRAKKAGNTGQSPAGTNPDGDDLSQGASRHPDPTRPDPTNTSSPNGEEGARKRATRIPEPFIVTGDMKAWARDNVPGLDYTASTQRFVDHWRAESGAKARKLDWVATWRNWLRRDHDNGGRRHRTQRPSPDDRAAATLALAQGLEGIEA